MSRNFGYFLFPYNMDNYANLKADPQRKIEIL